MDEFELEAEYPYIHLPKKDSKNKRSNRLPLPNLCVIALKLLPSYEKHEYLFPARPNVKYRNVEAFQNPHAWDIGKRFRGIRDLAGITDLRIHDLRHFATTMLFIEGISDAIIRKMTGHRSDELKGAGVFCRLFHSKRPSLLPVNGLANWRECAGFRLATLKMKRVAKTVTLKLLIIKKLMAEPTGLAPRPPT